MRQQKASGKLDDLLASSVNEVRHVREILFGE